MSVYRAAIVAEVAEGARHVDLHAHAGGVRTTLVRPDGALAVVEAPAGEAPSIVDLLPAAAWDEREAFGTGTDDPPPGPDGAYEVAVGPIHAGVIESGHFRFRVVGDRIEHLAGRLGYKHRGLERLAEGRSLADGLEVAQFACMACSVTNAVAYAQACEQVLGLAVSEDVARARTVLLELERVWSHLNDLAAICAGVGAAPGFNALIALVEEARRLNATLTGHRFLRGRVAVGASDLELDAAARDGARTTLEDIGSRARTIWRALSFNGSFQARLPDVGVVAAAAALAGGAAGPALRAAGIAEDLRASSPRLAYDGFVPVVPESPTGDVRARTEQRALELPQSLAILDALLAGPIVPGGASVTDAPVAVGTGRVESPRGATTCIVHAADGAVARLRLRTGSYANWPVLAACAPGNILPDFPLINKSFELCYGCADR